MSIFLNKDSKVIVQGMTGSEGMKHTTRMLASGTNIVGGVNPRKAGDQVAFPGEVTVPVFGSVKEAMDATGADVSVLFVPPAFTKAAVIEAIDAELESRAQESEQYDSTMDELADRAGVKAETDEENEDDEERRSRTSSSRHRRPSNMTMSAPSNNDDGRRSTDAHSFRSGRSSLSRNRFFQHRSSVTSWPSCLRSYVASFLGECDGRP